MLLTKTVRCRQGARACNFGAASRSSGEQFGADLRMKNFSNIVYNLFYPAILGSMIFELFDEQHIVNFSLLAFATSSFIVIMYICDYLIVTNLRKRNEFIDVTIALIVAFLFKAVVMLASIGRLELGLIVLAIIFLLNAFSLFWEYWGEIDYPKLLVLFSSAVLACFAIFYSQQSYWGQDSIGYWEFTKINHFYFSIAFCAFSYVCVTYYFFRVGNTNN